MTPNIIKPLLYIGNHISSRKVALGCKGWANSASSQNGRDIRYEMEYLVEKEPIHKAQHIAQGYIKI